MSTEKFLKKYEEYSLENIENLLFIMKDDGLSMMQSAMILVFKFKLTIKEADNYILNSEAWKQTKDITEKLRNDIFENLNKLNKS